MATITLHVEGDERTQARLSWITKKLADLNWLWLNLLELFVRKEALWFASEGAGSWPALSPTYAAWKAVAFPGRPLLVRTGELRDSLTDPTSATVARTDRQLILGTTLPYAAYHAEGTANMPARPPLIDADSLLAGLALRISYEFRAGPLG